VLVKTYLHFFVYILSTFFSAITKSLLSTVLELTITDSCSFIENTMLCDPSSTFCTLAQLVLGESLADGLGAEASLDSVRPLLAVVDCFVSSVLTKHPLPRRTREVIAEKLVMPLLVEKVNRFSLLEVKRCKSLFQRSHISFFFFGRNI
jgi:hypothetical protein